jgi:hypothetical protein
MLGLNFNRLSAAEESTGFRSVSYLGNMSTYIFFIVIGAVGLVIMVILFFGCKSRVKKYIKARLDGTKKKFNSLNPQIGGIHATYIESTISF